MQTKLQKNRRISYKGLLQNKKGWFKHEKSDKLFGDCTNNKV